MAQLLCAAWTLVLIISVSTTSKLSEQSKSFSVVILTYCDCFRADCFDFRTEHADSVYCFCFNLLINTKSLQYPCPIQNTDLQNKTTAQLKWNKLQTTLTRCIIALTLTNSSACLRFLNVCINVLQEFVLFQPFNQSTIFIWCLL